VSDMTSDPRGPSREEARGCGTVAELWRYPVKSMRGERRDTLAIDERGVAGDRLYAVRDAAGKLGSGKNSRRFRRMDGLAWLRARYDPRPGHEGDAPIITFPDGREVRGDDERVHDDLRRALDRPDVTLVREQAVAHHDQDPLHIVTDASLAWLAAAVPGTVADARRLRPNLVIRTGRAPGPIEDAWAGRTARIGGEVVIEFTERTERCEMVNAAQEGLTRSGRVLKAIADGNDLTLGVYARVVRGGTVAPGDALRLQA
jgi:uncharacterized protein